MTNLLLVVHVTAMAAWLGADAVQFVIVPRMLRQPGDVATAWAKTASLLVQSYYNAAGIVLGVSGVLLVLHDHWSWSAGFVLVGIATLVIGAVLGMVEFLPVTRRQAAASAAGDGEELRRLVRRNLGAAVVDISLVLLTVVVMVVKWRH